MTGAYSYRSHVKQYMQPLFDNQFSGRTVLVTGHTGFKGSWLATWLVELGAEVIGYSLEEPPSIPNHFDVSGTGRYLIDVRGDVRDLERLRQTLETYRPELVFHLAAQPLVIPSYDQPHLTVSTNVGGTLNLLEAIRTTDSVRAAVCITTDKVYENREWLWGYRETDRLGGHDPYSASKAMAELLIEAYRRSFFGREQDGIPLASARAGNVIGGGDFAEYRLVPDCLRALLGAEPIPIRNPQSVRPWQHVLEPLSGYLWLAARLLREGQAFAGAWNFGPLEQHGVTTAMLAEKLVELWGSGSWVPVGQDVGYKETGLLRLSWEKAAVRLGWRPVYTWEEALAEVVAWFQAYQAGTADMNEITRVHIRNYVERAGELGLAWAATH